MSASPNIRAMRAALRRLDGSLAIVTVVISERLPEVILFNGDPFVPEPELGPDIYREVSPFRAVGEEWS